MRQAIGIDIGARTLWVAYEAGKPPARINLKDADWQAALLEIVQPGATVALEPTGWAYSAPIIRTLKHIQADVYMVEHSITGSVRASQVAAAKTDQTDAHALRKIALTPHEYRGVARTDERLTVRNVRLRLLVHSYLRAEKECTRATNRARQLAHSIHPRLGLSWPTYRKAARLGFVTPDQLRLLAGQVERWKAANPKERADIDLPDIYKDGRAARHFTALVNSLPVWASAQGIDDLIALEIRNFRIFNKQRRGARRELYAVLNTDPEWQYLAGLWMSVPSANFGAIGAVISATHGVVRSMTPDRFRAAVGCTRRSASPGPMNRASRANRALSPRSVRYTCGQ
ncbi:MAG: IS110 family transposase [Chloroflexaceae bacterium]|nr:IS110 family transposase [Chloroflexaceae bacterium]